MKKGLLALFTICVAFLFSLGNVKADTNIAGDFESSFVKAVTEKYGITEEEFTKEWASSLTELDISNAMVGGIDKGGTNPYVLTSYFPNLKVLNLSGNNLGGIPNLPAGLTSLDLSNNNINGLPDLAPTITYLNLSDNELAGLPDLPANLEELYLDNNNLEGLPNLPATLKTLSLSGNALPGLPDLPGELVYLDLSDNELPGLPPLPATLKYLDIADNEIPDLLPLPGNLISLNISNNLFTELPTLPGTLEDLDISGNEIKEISASQLPGTLVNFTKDDDLKIINDLQEDSATTTTQAVEENPNTADNVGLYVILALVGLGVVGITTKSLIKHH